MMSVGRIKEKDRRIAGCLLGVLGRNDDASNTAHPQFEIFGGLHLAGDSDPPLSDPSALCPLPSAFFKVIFYYFIFKAYLK